MTQSPRYTINGSPYTPSAFYPFLETLIKAVADQNAGNTAPPLPFAFMLWRDTSTTPAILKIRNAANSAWVPLLQDLMGTTAISTVPLGYARVNAAGNSYELRSLTQTRADLGIIGIGADVVPTVTNLNTLAIGGQYFVTNTATGLPVAEAGFVYHSQGNVSDRAFQIFSGFSSERQFFRTNQAETWSGWKETPTVISMTTAIAAYAPPAPVTATGAGQWRSLRAGPSVALVLPNGGTWSWFLVRRDTTGAITTSDAGVSAGGTTIAASGASFIYEAFCWRIA